LPPGEPGEADQPKIPSSLSLEGSGSLKFEQEVDTWVSSAQ
jgi:hypothetical protein